MLSDRSGGIDAPAAIILETVQGEGGLNVASPKWVKHIAALAKKHGALLIIDDIQAGSGRCGTFFSFEEMGVTPDIVTLAKSVSGFGLPMAMVLVRPEYDIFGPAEHNGTFRGNTHAFVTAQVAIKKFWADDTFQTELVDKAKLIHDALVDLAEIVPVGKLKGRGLMQGVDVGSGDLAADICARAYEKGLIIETSGNEGQVIKVLAPLTTPVETFHKGFDILLQAARDVTDQQFKIAAE
jgi:diaminobutyrate-2-oxoglutarate transaminase